MKTERIKKKAARLKPSDTENKIERLNQLRDDAARLVQESKELLADTTRDTVQSGTEMTSETYDAGLDKIHEGLESIQHKAEAMTEETSEHIRQHPLSSVGLTLGAGLVLGSVITLISRRSQ
jgi:ElaB/YqjD/DUF883 family membrane-anchored ribosome-binding protein